MIELQQHNGETLSLAKVPQKIVSLVPSVTETMIEWGQTPIARTQFCIYPKAAVKMIPHIKGTKNPNLNAIKDLNPDLIIANKEENRPEDIDCLQKDFPVWISYPEDITSTINYMNDLAKLCPNHEKIEADIKSVKQYFSKLNKDPNNHRIACFIWKKPWMVAADQTYISSLIESYSKNAFSDLQRYPMIDLLDLKKNEVTNVFLLTEPFCFNDTHKQEFEDFFNENNLKMSVSVLNGENFTWPGPRSVQAIEEMKRVLN